MANNLGKITQVIGPVVDVSFDIEKSALPTTLVNTSVAESLFVRCGRRQE